MIRNGKAYICVFAYPHDWNALRFPYVFSEKTREMLLEGELNDRMRQSAAAELAYRAARMAAWKEASAKAGESPFIEDPNEWTRRDYIKNENGKPILSEGFVSIAHTPGLSAAAFSFAPVGIDAERERNCTEKLIRRTLGAEEYGEYERTQNKQAFFLRSWTAKESCLKLTGEGVGGPIAALRYDRERRLISGGNLPDGYRIVPAEAMQDGGRVFISVCCPKGVDTSVIMFSDPIGLLIYINAIC